MVRWHVIGSIFRRNFAGYFANPTGYVFIAVFVGLSAMMAFWTEDFFSNNLANLDTLNRWFPFLLLFFVPAVAMGTWSEERKNGTEELLLTLPARDGEILAGKYLAALGIYTVSLGFSLANVAILFWLGSPDLGVMFGTYLGYWFYGAGLLAVAMMASMLASNMTIAFILGALFCAVPVFLDKAGGVVGERVAGWLESAGPSRSFEDLAKGVFSLRALAYFGGLAAVFLFVNLVMLARRRGANPGQLPHQLARVASLLVIPVCLSILAGRGGCRADLTAERLYSLNPATREVIAKIDEARPVAVQAFVSPQVPTDVVASRETLLGLLREIDARAGAKVEVRIVDTEKYSAESREAEAFGIRPVARRDQEEGAFLQTEIFMGVAFRCGAEEVVLPFISKGMSIEYELTRAIGTVAGQKRKKVGIATTDAKVFGGFDMATFRQSPDWPIVTELKRQYEVSQVSLDAPLGEALDCLIAPQPSSLSQAQMDNLLAYVRKGHATILLDDPFPTVNPGLVPSKPKGQQRQNNPFMPPQPTEPKGDIRKFYEGIGVSWNPDSIVWDPFNPHKQYIQTVRKELVFASPLSGGKGGVNQEDPITRGLQEVLFFFAGELQASTSAPGVTFTPLFSSSEAGGSLPYTQLFQSNPFGGEEPNPFVRYVSAGRRSALAARVQGSIPATPPATEAAKINAVVVADLDAMSPWFHEIRDDGPPGLVFDNLTFILNAVDVLAGDTSYVELRKRRPKHRTLEQYEAITKQFMDDFLKVRQTADDKAQDELKKAQASFDEKVAAIEKEEGLDIIAKERKKESVRQMENRKLELRKREIDDQKKEAVEKAEGDKRGQERKVRATMRLFSVGLPPIPAVLIAILVFGRRRMAQRRTA